MFLMKTIAERIKEGMDKRELRQADIIEKTGINKGALSSYISGRYEPKQNNIYLLAKALDVSEAWLMGADVPMDREPTLKKLLDERLQELNMSLETVSKQANVPSYWLQNIDSFVPGQFGDEEIGYEWITKVAEVLDMPGSILRTALAKQEIPLPNDLPVISAKEAFADSDVSKAPTTIAAHFDGTEYTEEQLNKIRAFAAFIKAEDQKK